MRVKFPPPKKKNKPKTNKQKKNRSQTQGLWPRTNTKTKPRTQIWAVSSQTRSRINITDRAGGGVGALLIYMLISGKTKTTLPPLLKGRAEPS